MTLRAARHVFITGRPGVGKTTLVLRVADALRARGYAVGGMVTRELREHGVRVGFEVIDLMSGARGILAHVKQPFGPRVGKYRVKEEDLVGVGVKALEEAAKFADLVCCDEVGPMELTSPEFVKAVELLLAGPRPLLGTVHYRARHPLVDRIKSSREIRVVELTYANRDTVFDDILRAILRAIEESKR